MDPRKTAEKNKIRDTIKKKSKDNRASIKEKLESLPENTCIDRYVLRNGKLVHLKKDNYKALLKEKTISLIESKEKIVVPTEVQPTI